MPGAAVVLIVRHPFTRWGWWDGNLGDFDLWCLSVYICCKWNPSTRCLVCVLPTSLPPAAVAFSVFAIFSSRLISAFRDKLERQTSGNAYLERWFLKEKPGNAINNLYTFPGTGGKWWEILGGKTISFQFVTLLRESAVEKFGEAYFSAENNFGAPFAPKVIIQHNIYSKPFFSIL